MARVQGAKPLGRFKIANAVSQIYDFRLGLASSVLSQEGEATKLLIPHPLREFFADQSIHTAYLGHNPPT